MVIFLDHYFSLILWPTSWYHNSFFQDWHYWLGRGRMACNFSNCWPTWCVISWFCWYWKEAGSRTSKRGMSKDKILSGNVWGIVILFNPTGNWTMDMKLHLHVIWLRHMKFLPHWILFAITGCRSSHCLDSHADAERWKAPSQWCRYRPHSWRSWSLLRVKRGTFS